MMAPMRLLSVSCGPARGQTKQREGRKLRARSSDHGRAPPIAGRDGREWRRTARRSAAVKPLPANGVSQTTSDPPSSRGAELPLLNYSYSALDSENMRKWVSAQSKSGTSAQHRQLLKVTFGVRWTSD